MGTYKPRLSGNKYLCKGSEADVVAATRHKTAPNPTGLTRVDLYKLKTIMYGRRPEHVGLNCSPPEVDLDPYEISGHYPETLVTPETSVTPPEQGDTDG